MRKPLVANIVALILICSCNPKSALLIKAENGDPDAQYKIGLKYIANKNTAQEGLAWIERAASQNYLDAQFHLGWLSSIGMNVQQNDDVAAKWFNIVVQSKDAKESVLSGDVEKLEFAKLFLDSFKTSNHKSQFLLAKKYSKNGENLAKYAAAKWYKAAAKNGNLESQMALGKMFLSDGQSSLSSNKEAVIWLSMAANQDSPEAHYLLGLVYLDEIKNYSQSFHHFYESAMLGYVDSFHHLGIMYLNGWGTRGSVVGAVDWFHKGAQRNQADSQFLFALMHLDGKVPSVSMSSSSIQNYIYGSEAGNQRIINEREAAEWCLKSAKQGHVRAQRLYGELNDEGRGVPASDLLAVEWFKKAASGGDKIAQYKLGVKYLEGRGVTRDKIEAEKWIREAAEKNHVDAQYQLGCIMEKKDISESYVWLSVASANGHDFAESRLNSVESRLDSESLSEASKRSKKLFEKLSEQYPK